MLLRLENIHAGFNGREILNGLYLNVNPSEITCIIGPNGAGKSTVLKIISGLLYSEEGAIIFDGKDITSMESHKRISLGIGYFLQGGEVFQDLSVYENLEIGGASLKKSVLKEQLEETLSLFPTLRNKLKKRAGLLSGGEKQMLALGMIMLNRPKLILLDEPSAGLAPGLINIVMGKIVELNRLYGSAILLVEQKIEAALKISNKAYLLQSGLIAVEGTPEDIREAINQKVMIAHV